MARIDRIYGYLNFETRLYGVLCKKLCTWQNSLGTINYIDSSASSGVTVCSR